MSPHQNTCRQGIPHTPCRVNDCLKDNHDGNKRFSTVCTESRSSFTSVVKDVTYLWIELHNLVCRSCAARRLYNLWGRSSGIPVYTGRCSVAWGRIQECRSCYLKGERAQVARCAASDKTSINTGTVCVKCVTKSYFCRSTADAHTWIPSCIPPGIHHDCMLGSEAPDSCRGTSCWSLKNKSVALTWEEAFISSVRSDVTQVFKTSQQLA